MKLTKNDEALVIMIENAIEFANWAAGEGIVPMDGAPAPDEFLYDFANVTDEDDWDTLPSTVGQRIREALSALAEQEKAG